MHAEEEYRETLCSAKELYARPLARKYPEFHDVIFQPLADLSRISAEHCQRVSQQYLTKPLTYSVEFKMSYILHANTENQYLLSCRTEKNTAIEEQMFSLPFPFSKQWILVKDISFITTSKFTYHKFHRRPEIVIYIYIYFYLIITSIIRYSELAVADI